MTQPKCSPCNGGSIDCAWCEHRPLPRLPGMEDLAQQSTQGSAPQVRRITLNPPPRPALSASSPLGTQVGGSHYKGFKIQPLEFAVQNGLSFLEGNAVKYTVRKKGDKAKRLEDLRKAIDCIEKLIHYVETDVCS